MLVVCTLIIQLSQAYETYSFNAGSERQIFQNVFQAMDKNTFERLSAFSKRRYEHKYFGSYQNQIQDL